MVICAVGKKTQNLLSLIRKAHTHTAINLPLSMCSIHVCGEIYYHRILFLFGTIHRTKHPPKPLISFTLISLNKFGRLNRFDGTSHPIRGRRRIATSKKKWNHFHCGVSSLFFFCCILLTNILFSSVYFLRCRHRVALMWIYVLRIDSVIDYYGARKCVIKTKRRVCSFYTNDT